MLAVSLDVKGERVDQAFVGRVVAAGDEPAPILKAMGESASGDSSGPISVIVLLAGRIVKPGSSRLKRREDDDAMLAYEWLVPLDREGLRVAAARLQVPLDTVQHARFQPCAAGGSRVLLSLKSRPRFACGEQKGLSGRTKWASDAVGNPALPAALRAAVGAHLVHELFFSGEASDLRRTLQALGVVVLDDNTPVASNSSKKRRLSVKTSLVFDTPEKAPVSAAFQPLGPAPSPRKATPRKDKPQSPPGPAPGTPVAETADREGQCEFCGSTADDVDEGELIACSHCAVTYCSACSSQHRSCRRKSVGTPGRRTSLLP